MIKLIDLKIGRVVYAVTNKSVFVDNGSCVQLISDEVDRLGNVWVVLTNKALKEIGAFKSAQLKTIYTDCSCFVLLEQSK